MRLSGTTWDRNDFAGSRLARARDQQPHRIPQNSVLPVLGARDRGQGTPHPAQTPRRRSSGPQETVHPAGEGPVSPGGPVEADPDLRV